MGVLLVFSPGLALGKSGLGWEDKPRWQLTISNTTAQPIIKKSSETSARLKSPTTRLRLEALKRRRSSLPILRWSFFAHLWATGIEKGTGDQIKSPYYSRSLQWLASIKFPWRLDIAVCAPHCSTPFYNVAQTPSVPKPGLALGLIPDDCISTYHGHRRPSRWSCNNLATSRLIGNMPGDLTQKYSGKPSALTSKQKTVMGCYTMEEPEGNNLWKNRNIL